MVIIRLMGGLGRVGYRFSRLLGRGMSRVGCNLGSYTSSCASSVSGGPGCRGVGGSFVGRCGGFGTRRLRTLGGRYSILGVVGELWVTAPVGGVGGSVVSSRDIM